MAKKNSDIFGSGATGRPAFSDGGRSGDGYWCDTTGSYSEAEAARKRGIAHQRAALGYSPSGPGTHTTRDNIAQATRGNRQKQTWGDEGQYRNEAFNNFGWPGNDEPVTKVSQGNRSWKRKSPTT